jgi:hypothetical protein
MEELDIELKWSMIVAALVIVAIALALAGVAHAQDAALVAQTLTGDSRTVEAVSWELTRPDLIEQRRVWGDLFGVSDLVSWDLANAGVGLSVDVTPRANWCAGVGYYGGWMIYGGRHVTW